MTEPLKDLRLSVMCSRVGRGNQEMVSHKKNNTRGITDITSTEQLGKELPQRPAKAIWQGAGKKPGVDEMMRKKVW